MEGVKQVLGINEVKSSLCRLQSFQKVNITYFCFHSVKLGLLCILILHARSIFIILKQIFKALISDFELISMRQILFSTVLVLDKIQAVYY